jgi:putative peptidoglycan lipid II flippase
MSNSNSRTSQPDDPQNTSRQDSHRSLIRNTSVISIGTLASRILGFFRDIIIAKLLGTGIKADAFFVALKIPNLFRDLVGEGATNAAIVPVFSEYRQHKDKVAFWNFVSVVFALGLILLSVITILGIIFAPVIVRALAPGFMSDPEKLKLTIDLTRFMFPYLVFIGLTSYSVGILYTFRSFTVPAFSPCLFNIAIIVCAYFSSRWMKDPVVGLAIGVLIGGVLQLVVQIKPVFDTGIRLVKPKTLRHPGAKKIGMLLIPRVVGSGVYQLTVLIDTFCASLSEIVGPGGISAIYYANRIIQFPMGVFSLALASAVLPTLTGLAQKKDIESIKKTIVFSLENIFFLMCPMTMIILLLSKPIVQALFERGEFGIYSTEITASASAFLALGLFSFGGIKILVTAFHALQDTKTPVIVAAFCLAINATLNIILMYPFKVSGIALASAIAGTIDFLILFYLLEKRLGRLNSGLFKYFLKVTCASFATGIVMHWAWNHIAIAHQATRLIFISFLGIIFYELVCLVIRVEQAQKIWRWFGELNIPTVSNRR